MNILEALSSLDTFDDSQWTNEGLPKIDVVSELVEHKVTRDEITSAAPKFTRQNMDLDQEEEPEIEEEPEQIQIESTVLQRFLTSDIMDPDTFVREILNTIPVPHLKALEEALFDQKEEAERRVSEAEEIRRRVRLNLNYTQSRINRDLPGTTNQEAIMEYIKSSRENRAKRASQIQEIFHGLKPSEIAKLDPRAPIDRAFSRKSARGAQRPKR